MIEKGTQEKSTTYFQIEANRKWTEFVQNWREELSKYEYTKKALDLHFTCLQADMWGIELIS